MRHILRLLQTTVLLLYFVGTATSQTSISMSDKGISSIVMPLGDSVRNIIDRNGHLGILKFAYIADGKEADILTSDFPVTEKSEEPGKITFGSSLPHGLFLHQEFRTEGNSIKWEIELSNSGKSPIQIKDAAFSLPVCGINLNLEARHNCNRHASINLNASYLYWVQYDGHGKVLALMPQGNTSLEYATADNWIFFHSQKIQENISGREFDANWYLPPTGRILKPGRKETFELEFFNAEDKFSIEQAIADHGGVNFRVVPGMVVPTGEEIQFALRSHSAIRNISAKHSDSTTISKPQNGKDGFQIYEVQFKEFGNNQLIVNYGQNKQMRLDFYTIEPIETIIRKRADFITRYQQHTDTSKWYNGLFSVYNRQTHKLLSPDYMGDIREPYIVGGSDDPSNCKPLLVSEKNVFWPDKNEIAALEYYEKNFVWGKLQRTDSEYPYPYGIYGSDNWYENRSGRAGVYNSGGSGQERMWRTFDYVTHIAIYYNLYRIAKQNPSLVDYLCSDGYLDRAYNTAMAYFKVPYNIRMGNQWHFHGWCDWAYKQGNFHERYILDLIDALQTEGRRKEAYELRHELEKKVTYMVYEDTWPFGSEMYVDRTAYESSYYIAEYALKRPMPVHEQFWYDKNANRWYSYKSYPQKQKEEFMQNQLDGNLALRGIMEPCYWLCGTAWTGENHTLDYMTQMGGVALLDYGTRFADNPSDFIRWGYNSLLASWALVDKEGIAGWNFTQYNDCPAYMRYLRLNRGPWRYDGEIDHGLTGGIHGQGCYLVHDPLFGDIVYGGKLERTEKCWNITPWDGVRRYVALPGDGHLEIKITNGGFKQGTPVRISKDIRTISFMLEKRNESSDVTVQFVNLPKGKYRIGNDIFEVSGEVTNITIQLEYPEKQCSICFVEQAK